MSAIASKIKDLLTGDKHHDQEEEHDTSTSSNTDTSRTPGSFPADHTHPDTETTYTPTGDADVPSKKGSDELDLSSHHARDNQDSATVTGSRHNRLTNDKPNPYWGDTENAITASHHQTSDTTKPGVTGTHDTSTGYTTTGSSNEQSSSTDPLNTQAQEWTSPHPGVDDPYQKPLPPMPGGYDRPRVPADSSSNEAGAGGLGDGSTDALNGSHSLTSSRAGENDEDQSGGERPHGVYNSVIGKGSGREEYGHGGRVEHSSHSHPGGGGGNLISNLVHRPYERDTTAPTHHTGHAGVGVGAAVAAAAAALSSRHHEKDMQEYGIQAPAGRNVPSSSTATATDAVHPSHPATAASNQHARQSSMLDPHGAQTAASRDPLPHVGHQSAHSGLGHHSGTGTGYSAQAGRQPGQAERVVHQCHNCGADNDISHYFDK